MVAPGNLKSDPRLERRAGIDLQRLGVKLPCLGVVRLFFHRVGGLKITVGKLDINGGQLFTPLGRQDALGLVAIDRLGPSKIALPRQSEGLPKAEPVPPRTFWEILFCLLKDLHGRVVLLLKIECPTF